MKAQGRGRVPRVFCVMGLVLVLFLLSCAGDDDDSADTTDDDQQPDDDAVDDDAIDDDAVDDDVIDDDAADDDTYFPHEELFHAVLNRLVVNHWDPSGNWTEDIMEDATTFAPEVLFAYGYEINDTSLIDMGAATCLYELDLVHSLFPVDPDIWYAAGMGTVALWWGYRYDVDPEFALWFHGLVPLANPLVKIIYPYLSGNYFGPGTALGFIAHLDHEIARYETGWWRTYAIEQAGELIAEARENLWDEDRGLFLDFLTTNNATMLVAIAEHLVFVDDPELLAFAESFVQSFRDNFFDEVGGGFWDDDYLDRKSLSENSMALRGLIAMYEATGSATYRAYAEEQLATIESLLCDQGICYHHWTTGSGRADYFCTGCNFLLLDDMHYLHRLGGGRE